MKKLLILFLLLSTVSLLAIGEIKSVVKIYTTYQKHSYVRPWSMQAVSSRTGSGCIISDERILTNAHVVSDATFIEVRKADSPKKYNATVKFIAHDCDLAVLEVEDKDFFKGCTALELGTTLHISDVIKAYGFPRGGNKITATTGIISRIEKRLYAHSRRYYLLAQTDAAINPGNSGGPILKNDKIVGIAVQTQSGQNISYMVPLPMIQRFIKDISDGKYDGIPDIGVYYQKLRNPTMRESYKLAEEETGVFVNDIVYKGSADDVLIPGDIILEIDGKEIADDGTTVLTEDGRFNFGILANLKQMNDKLKLKIWRDGAEIFKEIVLKKSHYLLLDKEDVFLAPPNYYTYGGFVFVPASYGFLNAWGKRWDRLAPTTIVNLYFSGRSKSEKEQVIILSQVLPHTSNKGYHHLKNMIVDTVNGKKIRNFKDFIAIVDNCSSKYLRIHFDSKIQIIMETKKAKAVNSEVLDLYKIKSDRSNIYK